MAPKEKSLDATLAPRPTNQTTLKVYGLLCGLLAPEEELVDEPLLDPAPVDDPLAPELELPLPERDAPDGSFRELPEDELPCEELP